MVSKDKKINDKKNNKKKQEKDSRGELRGKLLFFEALLTIYALFTFAAAFMFEFHTVYVSGGNIIFSLGMSWQVILFTVEFATIVTQMISIAIILKRESARAAAIACIAGYAAGAASVICVIFLICIQEIAVIPLVPFSIYAVLICTVRTWIIPRVLKKDRAIA